MMNQTTSYEISTGTDLLHMCPKCKAPGLIRIDVGSAYCPSCKYKAGPEGERVGKLTKMVMDYLGCNGDST